MQIHDSRGAPDHAKLEGPTAQSDPTLFAMSRSLSQQKAEIAQIKKSSQVGNSGGTASGGGSGVTVQRERKRPLGDTSSEPDWYQKSL